MATTIKTEVTSTNKRSLQSMVCRLKQKVKELTDAGKLGDVGPIQQRLDSAQAQLNAIVGQEAANKPPKQELTAEEKAQRDSQRAAKLAELGLKKAIETAEGVLADGIKEGKPDQATSDDLKGAVEAAKTWLGNTDAEGIKCATKQLRTAIATAKSNIKAAAKAAQTQTPAQQS